MKGLIDQTGGSVACPFNPTFLRPSLSLCLLQEIKGYSSPHASNLLLEGMPSVPFVDANIPRDDAGALLVTQMHPKCFLLPFPYNNAMTGETPPGVLH